MAAGAIKAGTVVVCAQDEAGVPPPVWYKAQSLASQMFATAGVKIEWHCSRGPDAIRIKLTPHTPERVHPGALAYALAYQGSGISIYYDRVRQAAPSEVTPFLLGHVMVHEITHALQKCDEHSTSGVMKARWSPQDYARMQQKPLPFTSEDLLLIQNGLLARSNHRDGSSPLEKSLSGGTARQLE
jgi:hypothetical protein